MKLSYILLNKDILIQFYIKNRMLLLLYANMLLSLLLKIKNIKISCSQINELFTIYRSK